MAIQQQVHESFRVFVGASVEEIDSQVRAFTAESKVAAKSIGVEYLESKGRLVVSLGYRDDEEGYAASLASKSLGVVDFDSTDSVGALEKALTEAAASTGEVICHELFVTAESETHAVFLLRS